MIVSCDGFESKSEITEAKSGGNGGRERVVSRTPGKLSFTPLQVKLFVLKDDNYFEKWFKQIQDGKVKDATRDGSIKLYDSENTALAEWKIIHAWPSKLAYSDLDAESNDAMSLTVTLVYEDFERVQ
jgi:phage tail-like protein